MVFVKQTLMEKDSLMETGVKYLKCPSIVALAVFFRVSQCHVYKVSTITVIYVSSQVDS